MAGVVDSNGVQWEHCNGCGSFVKLHDLGFQRPCSEYLTGRDLCLKCVNALSQFQLRRVQPAVNWKRQMKRK